MDRQDRERLMLSTGIALVGYAIIFLLLTGLKWPPVALFHSITPPASVYVSLQGSALTDATETLPQTTPQPAAPPKATVKAPTPAEPKKASTTIEPPAASTTAPQAPSAPAAPSPSSSSTGPQSTAAAPVASQATAIPSRPDIPSSITSSAGPSAPTASAPQSANAGGAASASPGVDYPPGSQATSTPPQGNAGSGSRKDQGTSQTYYGPSSSSSGSFFNPALAEAAGTGSASTGAQGGSSSSSATGTTASGSGSGAGAGGTGTGTGSQASSSSGPRIEWKNTASARQVAYKPPELVIPRTYLDEIPPSISLKISFKVTPLGSVQALNVSPSTGYPGLDNLLEQWMEEWRFQAVPGNQDALGTLPYVIQATTAR